MQQQELSVNGHYPRLRIWLFGSFQVEVYGEDEQWKTIAKS